MATPSDPSNQEAVMRRKNNGPPIKFLIPLIYAPALPLIRLALRHKPVLRDRLFTAVLAGGFAHGFYLMYPFLDTPWSCYNVRVKKLVVGVWCVGLQNRSKDLNMVIGMWLTTVVILDVNVKRVGNGHDDAHWPVMVSRAYGCDEI
ncbi:hypothetical protein ACSQ67_006902 [Phaseolus vulgaris]